MKSIQIKRYGSSDVMEVNSTASVPSLPPGKILVNVKAAGVNPIDWKIREGYMQQMVPLQFPSTLGMDFSGVVKQIGENVPSEFKQGDEVYGQASVLRDGSGAFAKLTLVDGDTIAHKPKNAKPSRGCSFTACKKDSIHGGAGGIGSIAIQLAKHLGAYVATTVSSNDKQFVQELGADQVIDYKTKNFHDLIHNYDAVF